METVPGIKYQPYGPEWAPLNLQNNWISVLHKWPWASHSAKLVSGFCYWGSVIILYLMKGVGRIYGL